MRTLSHLLFLLFFFSRTMSQLRKNGVACFTEVVIARSTSVAAAKLLPASRLALIAPVSLLWVFGKLMASRAARLQGYSQLSVIKYFLVSWRVGCGLRCW